MAGKNQPDRWESLILAGALAVVGTWFLFDKFASLVHDLDLSQAILHASPALLVAMAVSLILVSAGEPDGTSHSREGRDE